MDKQNAVSFFYKHAASILRSIAQAIESGETLNGKGFNAQYAEKVGRMAYAFSVVPTVSEEEANEFAQALFTAGRLPEGVYDHFVVLTGWAVSSEAEILEPKKCVAAESEDE